MGTQRNERATVQIRTGVMRQMIVLLGQLALLVGLVVRRSSAAPPPLHDDVGGLTQEPVPAPSRTVGGPASFRNIIGA